MAPLFSDEKKCQPALFFLEKNICPLFFMAKKVLAPFFSSQKSVCPPCRLSRPGFPINLGPSLMVSCTASVLPGHTLIISDYFLHKKDP